MATDVLNFDLQKTIRLLPGYDPFAQAEGYWFDDAAAQFAVDFIEECCTFTKGTKNGKPLTGEPFRLEDWQKAIVANLWGWKQVDETRPREHWLRRYRECLLFVPRKNGKSELAAAIIVLFMYAAGGFLEGQVSEPGAEVYGAAGKRDQVRYIFDPVKKMILQESWLKQRGQVFAHAIVVGDASYKKISSEATTEHGGSTHLAVVDELHAQPDGELVDVLTTSMSAREQPLLLHVTTSDYEREESVCNHKHDYASKVRDGLIEDPAFLPVIYQAEKDDDWTDEGVWRRANPNLEVSKTLVYMQRECQRAKDDPVYENTFKRMELNVRTEQAFRLIPMDKWDACNGEVIFEDGAPTWGGLDLAETEDMGSLVLCQERDGEYHLKPFYWCPQGKVRELARRGRREYALWEKQGLLVTTPTIALDWQVIRAALKELDEQYDFREIAFDPWNCKQFALQLTDDDGLPMVLHRQGTESMNEPTKTLIKLMLEKQLRHGGHPVLRWNASNLAAVQNKDNNLRPDKASSGGKIDGMVGAIMSVGRAALGESKDMDHYDTHEVRSI